MHNSTAAMKNMPMTLIVSITKLKTFSSITIQILQLNNLVFKIRCKITPSKRHYTSEATKKCKKNAKLYSKPSTLPLFTMCLFFSMRLFYVSPIFSMRLFPTIHLHNTSPKDSTLSLFSLRLFMCRLRLFCQKKTHAIVRVIKK